MDIKALQNLLKANSPEEFHKKTLEVLLLKIDQTILFFVDNNQSKITGYKLFKNYDDLKRFTARLRMNIGYVRYTKKEAMFEVGARFYEQGWIYQYDGLKSYPTHYCDNKHKSLDEFKSMELDQIFDCNETPKVAA